MVAFVVLVLVLVASMKREREEGAFGLGTVGDGTVYSFVCLCFKVREAPCLGSSTIHISNPKQI